MNLERYITQLRNARKKYKNIIEKSNKAQATAGSILMVFSRRLLVADCPVA
jgi:hypothetical protein